MKVSILLPVYNGEKYLRESLESLLNQTYRDVEVLIGFNGTTDQSKEVAASYSDARIRLFDYGADKGKAKTLNKLLKEAQGEWIATQDDDDVWLPKKLKKQVRIAKRGKADVIGTAIVYCDSHGRIIGAPHLACDHDRIVNRSRAGDNQIASSSALFRKSDAEAVGGWDETLPGALDFDFWLRLMNRGCRFLNLRKTLVHHRLHEESHFNTHTYDVEAIVRRHTLSC